MQLQPQTCLAGRREITTVIKHHIHQRCWTFPFGLPKLVKLKTKFLGISTIIWGHGLNFMWCPSHSALPGHVHVATMVYCSMIQVGQLPAGLFTLVRGNGVWVLELMLVHGHLQCVTINVGTYTTYIVLKIIILSCSYVNHL